MKLVIIRQWAVYDAVDPLNKPKKAMHHPVVHSVLEHRPDLRGSPEEIERVLRYHGQQCINDFKSQFPEFRETDFWMYIVKDLPTSTIKV